MNNDNSFGRLEALNRQWEQSSSNLINHPYLNSKAMISPHLLSCFDVRLSGKNLLYPLRTLTSEKPVQYQTIDPSGAKRLHCSANGLAVFQVFGDLNKAKRILIAESLTKAAAIYQSVLAEDDFIAVINAVNSGGMVKCAKQFSQLYDVTVCADNDFDKSEKDATEGILKIVFNVVTELNLKVCTPKDGFKDFDDLLAASEKFGASEVWDIIKSAKPIEVKTTTQSLTDWAEKNPISELFNNPIQPREFLFENLYVPKGKVTICPAANGTGKTFLTVQIAIQAALGKCFMFDSNDRKFFNPLKPYKVLILSFEDDRQAFLERIHATIDHFPILSKNKSDILTTLNQQIEILELPAITQNPLLTCLDSHTNKVEPDQIYEQVINLINLRGFDLVFIDPMHYTTSAVENCNNQQGQHIRHITNIAERTGAAVFCFAHTTDDNPLRIRGATSIADRARSVFKVATVDRLRSSSNKICNAMAKSIIKQLPDNVSLKNVLWFKMDKNSYGKEDSRAYILQRHSNGVIAPMTITSSKVITDDSVIIEYIASCEKGYASKPMIENDIASKLSIAKSSIKNKLQAMVDKKIIFQPDYAEVNAALNIPNNRTSWYRVPEHSDNEVREFSGF